MPPYGKCFTSSKIMEIHWCNNNVINPYKFYFRSQFSTTHTIQFAGFYEQILDKFNLKNTIVTFTTTVIIHMSVLLPHCHNYRAINVDVKTVTIMTTVSLLSTIIVQKKRVNEN